MKMIRIFILLALCFSLFATGALSAQKNPAKPPQYFEDPGACPFECCTYREWTVLSNTVFYKDRATNSPVVFEAKKGEHVTGLTGVVITSKPGKAIVRKAITLGEDKNKVRARPGDALYLLHHVGEGYMKFWLRGRILSDQIYDGAGTFRIMSQPETVWWVKVKNQQGKIGWSKQTDHFGNMDSCG